MQKKNYHLKFLNVKNLFQKINKSMDTFDKIFYINLNSRTDRRARVEAMLNGLHLEYERFEAIHTPGFGILGCTLSHTKVLEIARERKYKNVLILEDDVEAFLSREDMDMYLNDFFSKNIKYDTLFLSYALKGFNRISENLIKIIRSSTAAAYVVNAHYYNTLINLWKMAAENLRKTRQHWYYANDAAWFPLQVRDNWYAIAPIFFGQEIGISDNSLSFQNYTGAYLEYKKCNLSKKFFTYGDSHANFSFKNCNFNAALLGESNYTMCRVGQDGIIPNFSAPNHDENSVLLFCFGEVDCRCEIQKQVDNGTDLNEVLDTLIDAYIRAIEKNVVKYHKVVIVGVIPPTRRAEYEATNGPVDYRFPFVGTDLERQQITKLMNEKLEEKVKKNGKYFYLYPYKKYENDDMTLRYDKSDRLVHLGDTSECIKEVKKLIFE